MDEAHVGKRGNDRLRVPLHQACLVAPARLAGALGEVLMDEPEKPRVGGVARAQLAAQPRQVRVKESRVLVARERGKAAVEVAVIGQVPVLAVEVGPQVGPHDGNGDATVRPEQRRHQRLSASVRTADIYGTADGHHRRQAALR